MDIEGNWKRIKAHRKRLSDSEIRDIAEVLYSGQEAWLCGKLILREDISLAMEFLGYLGKSGSAYAANILLNQLEAKDEILQIAAVDALKGCHQSLVFETLIQLLQRQSKGAIKAGEVLLSYGEDGKRALRNLWYEGNVSIGLRSQILQLLTEVKDSYVESLAYLAFLSNNEDLVRSALAAVEKTGSKGLWGNVVECLKSPSWRIRGRAVRLLADWREERALVFLLDMGIDDEQWVEEERQNAMSLLSQAEKA